MADHDMADPSEEARTYQNAFAAQLGERVTNLNRRQTDFEGEVRSGFQQINLAIKTLSDEMRGSNKTQWPVIWSAIGVCFVVLAAVGSQALSPIRESSADLKIAMMETNRSIQALAATTVSRQEMDWRSQRGAEDRKQVDDTITGIRTSLVTRNEWMERNLSRDHDIENIRADAVRDVANLQRQLDQQRSDYQLFANSLGNGRDFIVDLKSEQSRLRDQIAALTAKVAAEAAVAPR